MIGFLLILSETFVLIVYYTVYTIYFTLILYIIVLSYNILYYIVIMTNAALYFLQDNSMYSYSIRCIF